jgi:hypothetical protein
MEWVDHRNLPDRPPASAILNSLEKSQPLVGSSVGIRCELVHIGRILIRIVSNTAGTPSHQPSRLVHGHHALRRVGARARNAAAAPPSKDTNFRRPILLTCAPLCARPPNLGNYTTQRICGLRVREWDASPIRFAHNARNGWPTRTSAQRCMPMFTPPVSMR